MNDQEDLPTFTEAQDKVLNSHSFEDLLYNVNYCIKRICYVCSDNIDKMQYELIRETLEAVRDDLTDGGDTQKNINECLKLWEEEIKWLGRNIKKARMEGEYYRAAARETILSIKHNAFDALLAIKNKRII